MSVYKKDNPEFLKLALLSIYENQTRKPDEIVLVMDGPLSDDLYNVLNKFISDKNEFVKLIRLEKNMGLGDALRIGTQYCKGDYIFRMDSDDISDSSRFEKQINYLENHPEVDILGSSISEFEFSLDEKMRKRICHTNHNEIVKMSKYRNPMNHVSICMKKSALEKAGGYEKLLLLEDYYLWLKMIVCGCRFANLPESLVYVRVGNGFDTKRGSKERIAGWKFLQKYMLSHNLINSFEAKMNMLYIWFFVNTPVFIKKILYNKFLRKY